MAKKKQSVTAVTAKNIREFFEPSDKLVSGQELTKQLNEKYGTSVLYIDLQAFLASVFRIAGTDKDGFNAFKVRLKKDTPKVEAPQVEEETEEEEEE